MKQKDYELRLDYWTGILLFIKDYWSDKTTENYKNHKLTGAEITKELKLSYSHVVKVVYELEKKGLVTVNKESGSRGVDIRMTNTGNAVAEAIRVIKLRIGVSDEQGS